MRGLFRSLRGADIDASALAEPAMLALCQAGASSRMILTTRQEAALFAVLIDGKPTLTDLVEIQNLQAALARRHHTRQQLDAMSANAKEQNR